MIDKVTSVTRQDKVGNRLESIREANSVKKGDARTDRMEDYLEVIYELIEQKGYATTVDISIILMLVLPV
jgi:cupin superfamily acireductone dioxygenase involved in methionine salvage